MIKFGLVYTLVSVTFGTLLSKSVQREDPQWRIVAGIEAADEQFPFQVILKKNELDSILCGGTIIADYWVLTAAHCTHDQTSLFIIFGTTHLYSSHTVNMTATIFYEHPDYNPINLNNDISLIQLPTKLQFSKNIQPIALVPSYMTDNTFEGRIGIISGFGLVEDDYLDYSESLMWAKVEIIDKCSCIKVFGNDVVVDSTICARGIDNENQSICNGDSGGPLIARDNNNNIIQIGISSFVAEDMCSVGLPSGYVRITSFLQFIHETMKLGNINNKML